MLSIPNKYNEEALVPENISPCISINHILQKVEIQQG
jgi:hypothetical protein